MGARGHGNAQLAGPAATTVRLREIEPLGVATTTVYGPGVEGAVNVQ